MAVRALVMYLALIVLVRLGKKRFLGGATAFDYIPVILISSVAGRAMTGGAPYFASMLGILILIGLHWVFSAVACRSAAFSRLIKGHSTSFSAERSTNMRSPTRIFGFKVHVISRWDQEFYLLRGPSKLFEDERLDRSAPAGTGQA